MRFPAIKVSEDELACAAAGVTTRTRAHRPVTRAFRREPPRRGHGQRRAPQSGPTRRAQRLPFVSDHARLPASTKIPGIAYQTFTGGVTSVFGSNNAKRPSRGVSEAAGQGLEPQLPEPESGVLPLDDPAGRRADCSRPGGSDLEPVLRDEALLGIGVDVRDHLDVRLEPRPSQLRPQQPVDLEEA